MSSLAKMVRERWLDAQVSLSTHLGVQSFIKQSIGSVPLVDVDMLTLVLSVETAPQNAGSDPTIDLYVQRLFGPDPAVDAYWEDLYHFSQITHLTGTGPLESIDLPVQETAGADTVASLGGAVAQLSLTAKTGKVGDYYDQLRIYEKNGGTGVLTTAGIYTIDAVGVAS